MQRVMNLFGSPQTTKRKKIEVGITSRAPNSCCQWLVNLIMEKCSDQLEVRYLPITNYNRRDWEEAVGMCSAVILYHTKHQGRINVTDVEGSLYDTELAYLNRMLGREKVLVLLDDMSDESEEERKRILKTQPSLGRLSSHLILIPEKNKIEAANRKQQELFTAIPGGMKTRWREEESFRTHEPSSSVTSRQPTYSDDTNRVGSYHSNATSSKSNAASKPNSSHQTGFFSRSVDSNYTSPDDSLKSDDTNRARTNISNATSSKSNAASKPNSWYQIGIFSRSVDSSYTSLNDSLKSDDTNRMGSYPSNATSSKSNAASKPNSSYQIAIFSRSADSNYTWLVDSLRSDVRMRSADIKAICITNNYRKFTSELEKCQFAILYHTKKMGRLNITNVADSLYDNELRDMSQLLGKENVIVVVDDLQSTKPDDRERIVTNQPDICKYAKDLFLFTEEEKNKNNLETIRDIVQRSIAKHNIHLLSWNKVSFMSKFGSSVDSTTNKKTHGPKFSCGSSPSSSKSVDYQALSQKRDITESQSKKSNTLSSGEETSPMETKSDLSNFPLPDLLSAITRKLKVSEEEKQKLRETTLSQEEMVTELLNKVISLSTESVTHTEEIEELTKRNQDLEKTAKERERKLQDMEERVKAIRPREERVTEDEKKLEEREKMILKRERNISDHEKKIQEREKTEQLRETKVKEKEINTPTMFHKKQERVQDHETQPEDQERFHEKDGHLKDNLQTESGSGLSEIQKLREQITELQEMIEKKDRTIQKQHEEILNYTH